MSDTDDFDYPEPKVCSVCGKVFYSVGAMECVRCESMPAAAPEPGPEKNDEKQ